VTFYQKSFVFGTPCMKYVQKHFWKEHLCALQVFLCVHISWLVCAHAHTHSLEGTLHLIEYSGIKTLDTGVPSMCKAWCIMVKIGGRKKRKLRKNVNWTKIEGKFINLAEIGEYAICIIGLRGDGHPWLEEFSNQEPIYL